MTLSSKRGFTLIELMVALAIFSAMLVMLYSGLFAAYRATSGMEDSLLRLHEVRTTLDVIGREIQSAQLAKDTDEHPSITLIGKDYYGSPGSECTLTTFRAPSGGSATVSYYLVEGDGRSLSLYKKTRRPWLPEAKAEAAELVEDVSSFLVEVKDGDKWVSTWNGQIKAEVRITLAVRMHDTPLTLRLSVRPMIGSLL